MRRKRDDLVVGEIHGLDLHLACRLSDKHIAAGVCPQYLSDLIDLPAGIRQWWQDRKTSARLFLDFFGFSQSPQPYRQTAQPKRGVTALADVVVRYRDDLNLIG